MEPELVKLNRQDFETMDDLALCRACVWDAGIKMRATDMETRTRIFDSLTPGQQSVFVFWVLNARGPRGFTQLHEQLPHLVWEDSFWNNIRTAADRLGVPELRTLTDRFLKLRAAGAENEVAIAEIDKRVSQLIREELPRVSAYIRANPGQFVVLED
jgi:hypothetical protein